MWVVAKDAMPACCYPLQGGAAARICPSTIIPQLEGCTLAVMSLLQNVHRQATSLQAHSRCDRLVC